MPTYRNTAETSKVLGIYGSIPPGKIVCVDKYVVDHDSAFTLVEHSPAPWKKLHAAAPPATLTGLAQYAKIRIANKSGALISVVANGDSDDALTVLDSTIEAIGQDRQIETLAITGIGTGSVYVDGF